MISLFRILAFLVLGVSLSLRAAEPEGFRWGNVRYVNMTTGEKYLFEGIEIELLGTENHWNHLRVDMDTLRLKVSFRSPAVVTGNLKIFIADNRSVKSLSPEGGLHGLLSGDALVALCRAEDPLLDRWDFSFPVSFTGGYLWRNNEDSYLFSYQGGQPRGPDFFKAFPGIGLDMTGARGSAKHTVLAMESGRICWVEALIPGTNQPRATLCLESRSTPGLYYLYYNLYNKTIFVNRNQQVSKGDPLGYAWGDGSWEHLHIAVVKSDSVPDPAGRIKNIVNFFPQLLELYYGEQPLAPVSFSKGQIYFGRPAGVQGNVKNVSAFEDLQGTGWNLGSWNTADKVEWVSSRQTGNARLQKTLFTGEPAQCTNPHDWYEYEIKAREGIYRIRALVGDILQPSWQRIEFEGVAAGTYNLKAGETDWTPEKIVRVTDGKLTVRIYTGDDNEIAGIGEIVFQQAG